MITPRGGCRITFKQALNQSLEDAFTGDYDIHDLIKIDYKSNKEAKVKSPIVEYDYGLFYNNCNEYPLELKISCQINKILDRQNSCNTAKISKKSCNLIRHGAQSNYFDYQQSIVHL